MNKFIPLIILTLGIFTVESCRETDDMENTPIITKSTIALKKAKLITTTKITDSTAVTIQSVEEGDPPKAPIKW